MNTEPTFPPVPKVNDLGEVIVRPLARRVFDIPLPVAGNDEELLKHRFLCRGGGMLFVGQTGAGKSVFAMQAAILWGAGLPCSGLVPARALRSLLIQAENDDGDLAEMRDGVLKGLRLDEADAMRASANTLIHTESVSTSQAFVHDVFEPLIEDNRPDLVWIDPALAYLGGDSSSQGEVGRFLRNMINPVLHKFQCACVIVHHTNKPVADKAMMTGADSAYLGTGSAEWANWARAVVALCRTGNSDVYALTLGKRGGRARWKDDEELATYTRHIKHAEGTIAWVDAEPCEVPAKRGRPAAHTVSDILAIWAKGEPTSKWRDRCKDEVGINRSTFFKLLKESKDRGALVKDRVGWRAIPDWRPNRTSFLAADRAADTSHVGGSPVIQSSPESVQTNPSPGSSESAPKGAGLDWTSPDAPLTDHFL